MTTEPLWSPDPQVARGTAMGRFLALIGARVPRIRSYADLHAWSVEQPDAFWSELLNFTQIRTSGTTEPVCTGDNIREARWFPGLRLNFAENLLARADESPDAVAVVSISESRETRRVTFGQLRGRVARFAARLRELGIVPGDRVAGFIPNIDEAVVAMLGTASLGAIWSSCSPDFGAQGVLDRFGQIQPRILVTANGYRYNGKDFDGLDKVRRVAESIEGLEHVVIIDYLADHPSTLEGVPPRVWSWEAFCATETDVLPLPHHEFDHPLYIMYSSGTTGVPKCIVHGAGGTLLQHAKELLLHADLRPGDNIFYFTTCGWMMWNWLVSSLFVGATITVFDGSPTHPDLGRLWSLLQSERVTHFGTSPKFLGACRGQIEPERDYDLSALRVLLSTGAPLLPEDFDWVYGRVKRDLLLASISGGTDIISCFMLGNPLLPVFRSEIQAVGLGMDVVALGEHGEPVYGEKGELVCRAPFPSRPIYFWNDADGSRYHRAYFDRIEGLWVHGDYIEITRSQGDCGGVVVYGRSDATLNPGGVRIGTAEIYRLVETRPEIEDSIVVGRPWEGDVRVELYLKMAQGHTLSDELVADLRKSIRAGATPRHVPGFVGEVGAIPYTISGKKVELAVRQVLCGEEPGNKAALANPEALEQFRPFI